MVTSTQTFIARNIERTLADAMHDARAVALLGPARAERARWPERSLPAPCRQATFPWTMPPHGRLPKQDPERFVAASAAGRSSMRSNALLSSGSLARYDSVAREVGIDGQTAKSHIEVLERLFSSASDRVEASSPKRKTFPYTAFLSRLKITALQAFHKG
jgi:hypothetical protein